MKSNNLGIASLIMGIVAILLSCTCFNLALAIPGLILGIKGNTSEYYGRATAIAGIVCNIIAMVLTTIVTIWALFVFGFFSILF